MSRRSASAVIALTLLAVSLTMTGCSSSASSCFPGPLKADPASVAAGGKVTLSSPAVHCDLGYSGGHTYSVVVSNDGASTQPVTVRVRQNGAFSTEIDVPADFPHGEAYVLVKGSTYDDCHDTGSCAGYSTTVTIK